MRTHPQLWPWVDGEGGRAHVLSTVTTLPALPTPPTGSLVGQRLSDHPDVRKIGFTGSTEVGKHIMKR